MFVCVYVCVVCVCVYVSVCVVCVCVCMCGVCVQVYVWGVCMGMSCVCVNYHKLLLLVGLFTPLLQTCDDYKHVHYECLIFHVP